MSSRKKIKHHAPYDWDRWFKKKSFRLVQGHDFDCEVHGMASQIRNKASRRGLRVSLLVHGKTVVTTMRGKVKQ